MRNNVPGELILVFRPRTTIPRAIFLPMLKGAKVRGIFVMPFLLIAILVKVPEGQEVDYIQKFMNHRLIQWVELNGIGHLD